MPTKTGGGRPGRIAEWHVGGPPGRPGDDPSQSRTPSRWAHQALANRQDQDDEDDD